MKIEDTISKNKEHQEIRPSLSILLGSGFSVPMGYPTAKDVSNKLLDFDKNKDIDWVGKLSTRTDNTPSYMDPHNEHSKQFCFCKELIDHEKNEVHNYEDFYDFLKAEANAPTYKYLNLFIRHYSNQDRDANDEYRQYLFAADSIYQQMVAETIRDKNNNQWYDESTIDEIENSYDSFIHFLQEWSKKYVVNVHTLNHDLLFESFNKTDRLSGLISDGFNESDSPFIGKCHKDDFEHEVRLPRYTGIFNTPIRLYKLHGSIDYMRCGKTNMNGVWSATDIVKIRKGIKIDDDILRVDSKDNRQETYFSSSLHTDFLTGTTSKIIKYNDPLLYKPNFELFKKNLKNADILIIIGYGGCDSAINEMILEHFKFNKNKSYIINCCISGELKCFAEKIGAITYEQKIENFDKAWF